MNLLPTLTPTAWLIVGVLAAFLLFGAFCSYRGVQTEKDRQAASVAKIEARHPKGWRAFVIVQATWGLARRSSLDSM